MSEFYQAVLKYQFLQYALLTGALASIAGGLVGSYVVTRRITYIGGGIAHAVLGGMGVAYFLKISYGIEGLNPIYGALPAALIASLVIGLIAMRTKGRIDTVIGAVWTIGMAIGIIFIAKTPGYNQDLMSYLLGNILMVTSSDLWLIGALDLLVVILGLGFYRQITAVCFDEEFARSRGIKVELFYLMLLVLTALTVVILVSVVGIIMVIALLTLPAATANLFTRKMWIMIPLSILFSLMFTTVGMAVSYGPNLPSGAMIILIAGGMFTAASILRKVLKA